MRGGIPDVTVIHTTPIYTVVLRRKSEFSSTVNSKLRKYEPYTYRA
jgi:hypothetical protein